MAFVALAVGACGTPDEEAKPRPLPEETRKLGPGTNRTEEFEPAFSFEVGEGWTHLPPEKPDYLALDREQIGLGFFKVRDVYKPNEGLVEAPDDLVGWLRRHPYLRTSAPQTVTVGGIEGQRIDVVVGDLPEGHRVGACGPDCVDLFGLSDGTALGVMKGEKARDRPGGRGGRYGGYWLRRPGRRVRQVRARGAEGARHSAVEGRVSSRRPGAEEGRP